MSTRTPVIEVEGLTMAYGDRVIQRDLSFTVGRGDIFVIMGGSGCGKSTLLRHLIGLQAPTQGSICYSGADLWRSDSQTRAAIQRRYGVLFQSGALWSSLSLIDNVALPLTEIAGLHQAEARELAAVKLALVGLAGFEEFQPSEISGGMKKRAGLARAMALDPDILFFDEPSAGLDPISSAHLDELILELRTSLGATIVMVTHELASIFAVGDNSVFLDADQRTMTAGGDPKILASSGPETVRAFLGRRTS